MPTRSTPDCRTDASTPVRAGEDGVEGAAAAVVDGAADDRSDDPGIGRNRRLQRGGEVRIGFVRHGWWRRIDDNDRGAGVSARGF